MSHQNPPLEKLQLPPGPINDIVAHYVGGEKFAVVIWQGPNVQFISSWSPREVADQCGALQSALLDALKPVNQLKEGV